MNVSCFFFFSTKPHNHLSSLSFLRQISFHPIQRLSFFLTSTIHFDGPFLHSTKLPPPPPRLHCSLHPFIQFAHSISFHSIWHLGIFVLALHLPQLTLFLIFIHQARASGFGLRASILQTPNLFHPSIHPSIHPSPSCFGLRAPCFGLRAPTFISLYKNPNLLFHFFLLLFS